MDFSKLTAIRNANPAGQKFDLKWSKAKEEFRFSDKQFASMQLEYNSLTQFDHPDGRVIIAVVPGNDGVFYKKQKGKVKGKRVKNGRLSKACEDAGLDNNLTLVHLGADQGNEMYEIVSKTNEGNPYLEEDENQTQNEADPNQTDIEDEIVKSNVEPIKDEF